MSGPDDRDVHRTAPVDGGRSGLGRAVALMTASSVVVPVVGLASQPLLSHALGPQGRGLVQAAVAPSLVLASVVALGLPEAVTNLVARSPEDSRQSIVWACSVVGVLGVLGVLAGYPAVDYLSGGSAALGRLMLLALALAVPATVLAVVKGAAIGHQMWGLTSAEGAASVVLRLLLLLALWPSGHLTVLAVVLVGSLVPLATNVVYVRPLLRRHRLVPQRAGAATLPRTLLSFGGRSWLGSVAGILIGRADQMLMVPLASSADLGFYAVAVTISDAPIILVLAAASALFGVSSRSRDSDEVATTSRLSLLLTVVASCGLAATVGLFIRPVFGADFGGSVTPTRLLLLSQSLIVPALITGSGLAARGRPGLRSAALGIVVVLNVGLLFLLVPPFGVVGACWAAVASNVVLSGVSVVLAGRVMRRPVRDFLVPRRSDVLLLVDSVRGVLLRLQSRLRQRTRRAPSP